jgi:hypothetical protein
VIRDLARFLTILVENEITVENPFAWKTKSDVAQLRIAEEDKARGGPKKKKSPRKPSRRRSR